MAKVQARNIDDNIYENILRSAGKNERTIEGEIRFALNTLYADVAAPRSESERWARDVSERLRMLVARLQEDRFFRLSEKFDPINLARQIGERDPEGVLNAFEGIGIPSFTLIKEIARNLDCSLDWLLTGKGPMFRVFELGHDYADLLKGYMDQETGYLDENYQLHFIRITGNERHDGTLLLIIKDADGYKGYYESCRFNFAPDGVGGTGRGNLESFLTFLKGNFSSRQLRSFLFRDTTKLSYDIDSHHPCAYLKDHRKLDTNPWLIDILEGVEPKGFQFTEIGILNKMKKTKWRDQQ